MGFLFLGTWNGSGIVSFYPTQVAKVSLIWVTMGDRCGLPGGLGEPEATLELLPQRTDSKFLKRKGPLSDSPFPVLGIE
jgi:hypothetical protein